MTHMRRSHSYVWTSALLILALSTGPGAAQESRLSLERQAREALPSVITQLDVERRLLDQDLQDYNAVRAQEIQRRGRVELVTQEMDQLLVAEEPDLTEIAETQVSLDSAELAAEQAALRVAELRRAVTERLRRIDLLEDDLRILARVDPGAQSPISGVWDVEYQPTGVTTGASGTFDLSVDGSVVEGRYRLGDNRAGIVRGTYAGLTLRLELLESVRGLDAIFQGRYDPQEETLQGFWQPTELGAGEPGGGSWIARKLEAEEAENVELEAGETVGEELP